MPAPAALLADILADAGLSADEAAAIDIHGADPVFPLLPRAGETGAAAIAACGVAASALWRRRTGRRQSVAIDVPSAAAAMRSNTYLRVERPGGALEPFAEPPDVTGIYPTRDGRRVYLHCHFPHHQARTLDVLGCKPEVERVAAAALGWDGAALEEAVVAAGACAGLVRSEAEWNAHPQGRAVAALPLLEVRRIGDAPPEPLPALDGHTADAGEMDGGDAGPLSGVRALDLTRVLAGPTAARTLAEHGADVLRIGAPHLASPLGQTLDTGHGKRSAVLDLATDAGVAALRDLARDADVFSQGYRPGTLAARGLAPEAIAALRPGIVYVTLSAFGHEGPWAARRGFDTLVQCVSGLAAEHGALTGGVDGRPRLLPVSALDYLTGYLAAAGAMAALARRADEGGSWLVRVSLARTARWLAAQPPVPAEEALAAPRELPDDVLARLMTTSRSPAGVLHHLAPALRLSETPPHWRRPAVPLDHDAPIWGERWV